MARDETADIVVVGGGMVGLASAIALIIFFLTLAISLVNFKAAGVFEEARK